MSKQPRRHLSPQEKVAILKRHLVEGTPVSDLCDEYGLDPTVFYNWQRQLFENAHRALSRRQRNANARTFDVRLRHYDR